MKPYYQDDYATIYHGDCLELLPDMPKVDLVLTDPPYGMTQNFWDKHKIDWNLFWKLLKYDAVIMTSLMPMGAAVILANASTNNDFKYDMVWKKSHTTGHLNCKVMPLRNHEGILLFGKLNYSPVLEDKLKENIRPTSQATRNNGNYGKYNFTSNRTIKKNKSYPKTIIECETVNRGECYQHPTQKPTRLFKKILKLFNCRTILDPFMGSGTTLLAAKQLNRKAIGIEIEEKYCEIAVKRLSQEVLDLQ